MRRRDERGDTFFGALAFFVTVVICLGWFIYGITNHGWRDYRSTAVACDTKHPITFADHVDFTTNSDGARVLLNRPDCIELTWHWVDSGFHIKEHVALIGRFRIYEKAADQ